MPAGNRAKKASVLLVTPGRGDDDEHTKKCVENVRDVDTPKVKAGSSMSTPLYLAAMRDL